MGKNAKWRVADAALFKPAALQNDEGFVAEA
jgi:hypothetical protein